MCMRIVLVLCFFLGIRSLTSMPSFEEFMKDIDWDAALKSAEEMMQKNPELFNSIANSMTMPPGTPQEKSTPKQVLPPLSRPAPTPAVKIAKTSVVKIKNNPRSLFLDPLSDKEKVDPSVHVDIPKNKLESFEFHRLFLMLELKKLEKIIDQSPFFSIECKERLMAHKAGIDAIVIDLEWIASRSFYKRIFFAKENGNLRQSMLTALDQLVALNTRLVTNLESKKIATPRSEALSTRQEVGLLQKRATEKLEEPLKDIDTDLSATKKEKQFHRGKKLPRSQQ